LYDVVLLGVGDAAKPDDRTSCKQNQSLHVLPP
jgi:hypothetical protein